MYVIHTANRKSMNETTKKNTINIVIPISKMGNIVSKLYSSIDLASMTLTIE